MPADVQVSQVGITRTNFFAVGECGRLVMWKHTKTPSSPDASPWIPRMVGGLSGVKISLVSCGDSFTACPSDRGLLMTFCA